MGREREEPHVILEKIMDQTSRQNDTEDENRREQEDLSDQQKQTKFHKFTWLNQHFDITGNTPICKHCNRMYKNRHAPRLINHIRKCHNVECEDSFDVISETGQEKEINNLMVMLFIEANIPLRAVEMGSFKKWANKLKSDWVPPSRRDLSTRLIPRLSRKLHSEFQKIAISLPGPSLSIEFDHWQDVNGRSLLGVIATTPTGARHLLDLRDVSIKGHNSAVIVEDLRNILQEIPSQAINSIVSDSAASCKRARLDFVKLQNYSHVIQHRCLAHLLNRIEQRIMTKNPVISETHAIATKITSLISSNTFLQATLQSLNHSKLKQVCPTRWYYTVEMIESLVQAKDVILEEILPTMQEEKANLIRALDWTKLEAILEVLKPINRCIGSVEAKDASLGQAFSSLLNYAKDLFEGGYCSEFKAAARAAFLWHFSWKRIDKNELGLYIAAYILDRRHKMKYITQDGLYLALETLALIVRSTAPIQRIKSSLIDEFEEYRNLREDYALEDSDNNPIKWWAKRPSSILMQVATRLAHLKASSTNIERTFSTLKHIQGGSRVNLSLPSLLDIGRLKIATSVIYEDESDAFDLSGYDLQNWQQSSTPKRPCQDTEEAYLDNHIETQEFSEITESQEISDWLETQDLEIVSSYKWFFKYVNFSVIFEEGNSSGSQSEEASEEQIRTLVQQSRNSQNYNTVIDTDSQVARYDCEIIE